MLSSSSLVVAYLGIVVWDKLALKLKDPSQALAVYIHSDQYYNVAVCVSTEFNYWYPYVLGLLRDGQ